MANRRDRQDSPERENPYEQLPPDEAYDDYDEYDDDYEEYDPEEAEENENPPRKSSSLRGGGGGWLHSGVGKILIAVIALLVVLMIALLVVRGLTGRNGQEDGQLPSAVGTLQPEAEPTSASVIFAPETETEAPQTAEPTATPLSVFAPVENQPTQAPAATAQPMAASTATPTATPTAMTTAAPTVTPTAEPTATPLPIILTNTPTPTPTARATATPTPSPEPTPTPTPSPTPKADLATGQTNRAANLRESASSTAKVKMQAKKGAAVTIHESVLDEKGNVWYNVTVDDELTDGWMRDYVVNVNGTLAKPTATPVPGTAEAASSETTAAVNASAVGTGKANRDANLRKIMNGTVITTVKKGKAVDILDVLTDKNGNIWYQVQPQGSSTVGYMRDYVITLDSGVQLDLPETAVTPTPKPTVTPQPNALLDREIIGKATTNRASNIREKPQSGAKIVRQLSKGIKLMILDKYQDSDGAIWYEVSTETGKTYGFVRGYCLNITEIDKTIEAKNYGQ